MYQWGELVLAHVSIVFDHTVVTSAQMLCMFGSVFGSGLLGWAQ